MIKRKLSIVMIFFMISTTMRAQTLSPVTISSTGSSATINGIQLDWTMGESITTTFSSSGNGPTLLTQGSLQPELQIWTGNVENQVCAGSTIAVPVIASGIVSSLNIFTAQLSDSKGSFANAIAIGTLRGNFNGTITATVPSNIAAGTNYRIRVISSLPAFTGVDNGRGITVNRVNVAVPDAYVLKSGVAANTVYNGYAPASSLTLNAAASGGLAPYKYEWKDSRGNVVGSNAALTVAADKNGKDATYTVVVTDAKGCSQTTSKTISSISITCSLGKGVQGVQVCNKGMVGCVSSDQVDGLLKKGATLGSCSAIDAVAAVATPQTLTDNLTATAYPNPSTYYFSIKLNSTNTTDAITVRVMDAMGKFMEVRNNLVAGETIQVGQSYQAGIYYVQVIQGFETKQLKLVKTQ